MDALPQVRSSELQEETTLLSQADSDAELIGLWLHGKADSTRQAYQLEIERFLGFVDKPLRQVLLRDLQAFETSLTQPSPASRARSLMVVKSLLSFGQKLGYLAFNVGGALMGPRLANDLAERILSESQVFSLIALEPTPRNRTLLRLLYFAGLRVSEVCGLRCRHLKDRDHGQGQLTVHGKGGKTRHVLLPAEIWAELEGICANGDPDEPVLASRKRQKGPGGDFQLRPLDRSQVLRIVQQAARRAGISGQVSPHWLRHAHASHALDRGCPVHVLKETLGHASLTSTTRYAHARPGESSARYLACK